MSTPLSNKTLVILQPLFLPWLGMFDMMARSDLFVILNNVQFSRQSWQQRNRIKTPSGVKWLTVPVKHNFGTKIINVEIDYSTNWPEKHLKTISQSYRHTPFFGEIYNIVEKVYSEKPTYLIQLSIGLIKAVRGYLGISTPLEMASDVSIANHGGKSYVLDLCKYYGATTYLNGPAGKTLYSPEEFRQNGIKLIFHEYLHPIYPQLHGDFVSHLSVIDTLFNCGPGSIKFVSGNNEKI
ncbi:MAG: WbqC family protein [Patescibacteria group bacterium]